jgi:NAD(P)-dependent dehydrogenase (short-subunit alcohol dehydrogenase family)
VAVVTGGARGLGRATARLLAQRGAAVCVNYAVHADAAQALVAEILTAGGRAIAVAADVADSAAVEAMVARTEAELGPVTILVNNAGVAWQGTCRPWPVVAFRSRPALSSMARPAPSEAGSAGVSA